MDVWRQKILKNISKELYEVYKKYKCFDFVSYHKEIAKTYTNNKYSKGLGFCAGLYEPSYVREMRVTNCTIGKEVKKIENGFDYKYYFDENDRIILSEKYLDKKLSYINFYFYYDNVCEYIFYDFRRKTIYALSKSYYDEAGRINRHIELESMYSDFFDVPSYEEHLFRYEDDITYVTLINYRHPTDKFNWIKEEVKTTNMMIKDNILYYLDEDGKVIGFYHIRFKIVDGKKVNVPLPKKIPIFKIIKENMKQILNKWKDIDKSVIWILCESTDLIMQYTSLKDECEEKWNIEFYDSNEEDIFTDKNHIQVLEDLLFNNSCNIDDLINESEYFVNKMIKIIKELRKEGYILDETAVILSDLEISDNTLDIAKKINKKIQ